MRAFIAVRQVLYSPPGDKIEVLENRIKELKQYMEEVFMDQNDINEDTRIQLELINQTLSELQAKDRGLKERNRIGYILPDHEDKK